jgi:rhodanese-related sulfurtransferase
VLLGGLAPFAGSPYGASHSNVEIAALAEVVESEGDHVTALELAEWIRARKEGLRIIDVSAEREEVRIPGAERMTLRALVVKNFRPDETVVLYSLGGAHAAQGWVFLRTAGVRDVYFLRGGLQEWVDEVLNPELPASGTPAEMAEGKRIATLSRYFGGVPRVGSGTLRSRARHVTTKGNEKASIAAVRRRGC